MIDLFIKPGLKNFILLLGTWCFSILIYVFVMGSQSANGDVFVYFIRYFWPNFLWSYTLFIFIIPYFLDERNFKLFFIFTPFLLGVFIGLRYLNNSYWQADYYTTWDRDLKPIKESVLSIAVGEVIKLFPFTVVPLAVRLYVEWRLKSQQRNRLEYENMKAELATLRYQLNPHFMLNAMNNIYYLSLVKSDLTPVAVMKLSEQLRYMLYEKAEWVQLSQEVKHLRAFIDFHQIRFPDQEIHVDIQLAEKSYNLMIPPLIFLTFIENAFKHGKPGPADRQTKIRIFILERMLVYQVENEFVIKPEHQPFGGTGLENLKRRLELMYAERFAFNICITGQIYFAELKIPINQ